MMFNRSPIGETEGRLWFLAIMTSAFLAVVSFCWMVAKMIKQVN